MTQRSWLFFDQANTVDIWVAHIGSMKGHSTEVKQLAKMVMTNHQLVQQMGRDLAKAEGLAITPPSNDEKKLSGTELRKAITVIFMPKNTTKTN